MFLGTIQHKIRQNADVPAGYEEEKETALFL